MLKTAMNLALAMCILAVWACRAIGIEHEEAESWSRLKTISLGTVQSDTRTLREWFDYLKKLCQEHGERGGYRLFWQVDELVLPNDNIPDEPKHEKSDLWETEAAPNPFAVRNDTRLIVHLSDCSLYELINRMAPILGIHFRFHGNELWVTHDGFSGPIHTAQFRVRNVFWENISKLEYIGNKDDRVVRTSPEVDVGPVQQDDGAVNGESSMEGKVLAFFESMGIVFPDKTGINIDRNTGTLTVRHTRRALRNIEGLLRLTYSIPFEWTVNIEYGTFQDETEESSKVEEWGGNDHAITWSDEVGIYPADAASQQIRKEWPGFELFITPSEQDACPNRLHVEMRLTKENEDKNWGDEYRLEANMLLAEQSTTIAIPTFSAGWDGTAREMIRIAPFLKCPNQGTPYFNGDVLFTKELAKSLTPPRDFPGSPVLPEFDCYNLPFKEVIQKLENELFPPSENKEAVLPLSWILTTDKKQYTGYVNCPIPLGEILFFISGSWGCHLQAYNDRYFIQSKELPISPNHTQWIYLDSRHISALREVGFGDTWAASGGWDGSGGNTINSDGNTVRSDGNTVGTVGKNLLPYLKNLARGRSHVQVCSFGDALLLACTGPANYQGQLAQFIEYTVPTREILVSLHAIPVWISYDTTAREVRFAFNKMGRVAIRDVWNLHERFGSGIRRNQQLTTVNLVSQSGMSALGNFGENYRLVRDNRSREYFYMLQMKHCGTHFSNGKHIESVLSGTIGKNKALADWQLKTFLETGENYIARIPFLENNDDEARKIISDFRSVLHHLLLRAEAIETDAPVRHVLSY